MTTWHKGQAWRVAGSLEVLNTQIRREYPRAIPPATDANSWGALADNEHSSSSGHYPHFISGMGPTAVVVARDFPHAPALGLDGGAVTEALRLSRDTRLDYVIFNRRIFSGHQVGSVKPYVWRHYAEEDPHDTHFHVQVRGTASSDSSAPWQTHIGNAQAAEAVAGFGDDMHCLMRWIGSGAVFLTDGVTARHIASEEELADVQYLHRDGTLPLGNQGEIRVVGRIELLGLIAGNMPAGFESLAK